MLILTALLAASTPKPTCLEQQLQALLAIIVNDFSADLDDIHAVQDRIGAVLAGSEQTCANSPAVSALRDPETHTAP